MAGETGVMGAVEYLTVGTAIGAVIVWLDRKDG